MKQLYPTDTKHEPEEALSALADRRGRPWVFASAAMTLDGKINCKHRPLGGPADQVWYGLLHRFAETVVIGAENFRTASTDDGTRYQGKELVILSDSLDLPLHAPAFRGGTQVKIFTRSQKTLPLDNATVEYFRSDSWKPEEVVEALGERRILIDGGGDIYRFFFPVVMDWIVCSVPLFASDSQPSIWPGQGESTLLELRWLYAADNRLFSRWSNKALISS